MNVAAAIIEDGLGKILLAQRPAGKHLAGLWEFPGGKIEAAESPGEALVRELREELCLEVGHVRVLGTFEYRYDWGPVTLHIFVVRALSEPMATTDVSTFRWVTVGEVDGHRLAPADVAPWSVYRGRIEAGPLAWQLSPVNSDK